MDSLIVGAGCCATCDRLDNLIDESHSREVDSSDRCPLGVEMDTSQQATAL